MASAIRPQADLSVLSAKEMKALEEMREIFKNETYPDQEDANSWFQLEDWTYLRYLRARKYDVSKAAKMLKDTLEMRRRIVPHKLDPNDPKLRSILDQKFWSLLPTGKTKAAVQITHVGKFDAAKIEVEEDFEPYLVMCSELACRELAKSGWASQHLLVLFDFENFSLLKQANAKAMRLIKALVEINDLHYPEMLEKAILFNAPFLFRGPYKVIRPWLAKETEEKIMFVSNLAALDELMEAKNRIVKHGGTRQTDYPSLYYEEDK